MRLHAIAIAVAIHHKYNDANARVGILSQLLYLFPTQQ